MSVLLGLAVMSGGMAALIYALAGLAFLVAIIAYFLINPRPRPIEALMLCMVAIGLLLWTFVFFYNALARA